MVSTPFLKAMVVVAALLAAPSSVSAASSVSLIGEEAITSKNVCAFANRIFAETKALLKSTDWSAISNNTGIVNQGKKVSGVFAAAGVDVTRATATVNVPAQKLFDYMVTAEGYQLIDPFSKPEDFSKPPLESFSTAGWRGASATGKRLEVARTETMIPGIRTREFVVLNAIDSSSRTFVSKSVQHKGDPGCSVYGGAACYNASDIPVRALNTFAVQIEPLKTNASQCVVQLINYADLTPPEIPSQAQNGINLEFLPQIVVRMRALFP